MCGAHILQAEKRVVCVCVCVCMRDDVMMNASPAAAGDLCIAVGGCNRRLSVNESQ